MRNLTKAVLTAAVACAMGVLLVPSASAIDPRYTAYAGCPNTADVLLCMRAVTRDGHIQIGTTDVPIDTNVILSGGLTPDPVRGAPWQNLSFTSSGGITGNPLPVPGGLAGLTGISEIILNIITLGANRVYAQAVPAGQIRLNAFSQELSMPIKVNLLNPFIRPGCSIGSNSNPVVLTMIVGTTSPPAPNRPITGRAPSYVGPDPADANVFLVQDLKHVDNSFAAPRTYTCDLLGFGLISGLIDSRVGLPSAGGRNEAVFDHTDIRLLNKALVYP